MDTLTKSCGDSGVEGFLPTVCGETALAIERNRSESERSDTGETFSYSSDGHVVGRDGFVVPKDFDEFYQRNPLGVRRWLTKRLHRKSEDDILRELEQELLLHLCSLPEDSKYRRRYANGREQSCTDRIQCFDPVRQHGASAKRFFNYVSLCLTNRLYTLLAKRAINPICDEQTLTIAEPLHDEERDASSMPRGTVSGEYLYQHSSTARQESAKSEWQTSVQVVLVKEFMAFVDKEAPQLTPVVDAIACTDTLKEARELLGLTTRAFERHRNSIRAVKDIFTAGKDSLQRSSIANREPDNQFARSRN